MEENINPNQNNDVGSQSYSLPSARAGHRYLTQLGNDYLPTNAFTDIWIDGIDKTGLHFFPEKKQITGIPKNSGSYDMQLFIREYNALGTEELSTRKLTILIEDDFDVPFSEVDENAPYPKRDLDVHTISVNRGNKQRLKKDLAAASRRGHLHIEQGKIREDDFFIRYDHDTRWYALAVADGAGKSKYSRKGSQIACNSVVESCLEQLSAKSKRLKKLTIKYGIQKLDKTRMEIVKNLQDIISTSVINALREIESEARRRNCQSEDYATTLLMCICKKFEFGWLVGAFSVGDGAICVYDKDKWYANLLGGCENSGVKHFLTSPGIIQQNELERRICFTIVEDFSALFLMTNGVSDPKFGCEADMPCFELWNRFWDDIVSDVNFSGKINDIGEELLKWLDFWSPGKYDDRTIAVVF